MRRNRLNDVNKVFKVVLFRETGGCQIRDLNILLVYLKLRSNYFLMLNLQIEVLFIPYFYHLEFYQ